MEANYSRQLEAIVAALSRREAIPSWVIGLIGTVLGAVLGALSTIGLERWRQSEKIRDLKKGLCLEIASMYGALL